jgi:hypothetical protein
LRKRLEDIRKLTALRKGESVSTSEIAKQLLESAREDRFEVAELLGKPAEALLEIRRKGEAGQTLSRAQWAVVAYFVQQGSEAFRKIPSPANPTSESRRRSRPRISSAPSRPVSRRDSHLSVRFAEPADLRRRIERVGRQLRL